MADLKLDINIDGLVNEFKDLKNTIAKDLQKEAESLAVMTHAKLHELASERLKSLSKNYRDNIEFSNPEPNLWIVTLKEPAMWIEENRKQGSMVDDLLRDGAKVSASGSKYKVIPFLHSKPPSEQTPKAQALAQQIKTELKKQGVSWKKIEYNADGSPRTGLIKTFNVDSARPSPKAKTDALKNVAIYQTKQANGNIRRDVLTFRTVSEKDKELGKWVHPGREGNFLMDEVFEWVQKTWENDILPAVMNKYK
jgi:hypothetical protein